ncbi:2-amino-4-hydroxy-6-hydroxymethyldihydropteridine diphosphokinase [Flavobacterium faecale]|uniref:2-amino-4-hydroxy-6-hydroxymethyldihydropteridine pyrophosphokinase n=1 Tax=Flavobacterium faecale TaxID=1355330 RepID=A0A2S1L978_9FLAO|nr:2-amino-4-hydroxy-6-hydroxymethyldihydropteridine diphosphokinase [Flavobacterium faecale]AWG20287.1 2-amino-4-hydroxy-6-hydroxymethyldihydropteridine diphosphokinase [Flavobacterium faecale]
MKEGKKIVLSIGTNQGDKLENIVQCIQLIKEKIGMVTQVSKIYQTPSWGFESDPFFNCALELVSNKTPIETLELALAIEQEMGRTRSEQLGYQSRIIDIDLILFGNEVVDSEQLQLPHPLMQERKFVLLPLTDLNLDWEHPILKQSIPVLLENCSDQSECVVVQALAFL